jgi:hypothetical protein
MWILRYVGHFLLIFVMWTVSPRYVIHSAAGLVDIKVRCTFYIRDSSSEVEVNHWAAGLVLPLSKVVVGVDYARKSCWSKREGWLGQVIDSVLDAFVSICGVILSEADVTCGLGTLREKWAVNDIGVLLFSHLKLFVSMIPEPLSFSWFSRCFLPIRFCLLVSSICIQSILSCRLTESIIRLLQPALI